jgi:hypothetical protein
MNLEDISKREVLDFKQFRSRVMDDTFKPLAPEVQDPLSSSKTGLHSIKREPAYDWVGYANAIWSPEEAGITFPGYNDKGKRDYTNMAGINLGSPNSVVSMDTTEIDFAANESQKFIRSESKVLRLDNF